MDTAARRKLMVERQIHARGVRDPRVLAAMGTVPREAFLPPELADLAYDDRPLPIEAGQTISQPFIVALMAEALELRGDETVLEIGTGSGYAAAVLAHVAKQVYTIERVPELADVARERLAKLGYANVQVRCGDGTLGWPEQHWDEPMERMRVRPSRADSYERLCHDAGVPAFLLQLRDPVRYELRDELAEPRLERAIGVVYRPETELESHYFQAVLPAQFDEYIWFDETDAVAPLPVGERVQPEAEHPFAP